jgi:hypothetical protein
MSHEYSPPVGKFASICIFRMDAEIRIEVQEQRQRNIIRKPGSPRYTEKGWGRNQRDARENIGNWSACIISGLCVVGPRPDNLDWARQLIADPAIHSAIRVLIVPTISLERHSARGLTRLPFTLGSVRLQTHGRWL